MIFLDANVFLRALVRPDDPKSERMSQASAELFRRAALGEITVTTSDAVLAEVAFILTTKTHAGLPVPVAAGLLATIIGGRGFRIGDKRAILSALDLWTARPRLGFVDALTAIYAQSPEIRLATFDSDFDGLPGIDRWHPGESD